MLAGLAAQARLDEQIAALTLMLCNLRGQRNTFSLISRLPPEILAHTFILYAQSCKRKQPIGRRIPQWVDVSYVCRHWRDIALNCPALWSFLFASSNHWTNELLARSKMVPLKVRMGSEFPLAMQPMELGFLKKMAPHAYRIQELCLRLLHLEAERILPLFSSSAPLLQALQISVDKYNRSGPVLPRSLFDGDTPVLRELELKRYAFRLTSPTLCGLTHLKLRDLDTSFQPTLGELKVALSHMQNLEHLHLENALPSALDNSAGQSFEGSQKLSIPRLSRLSIIAPSSTVILLSSSFDLPLETQVRLRCDFEAGEDYTRIFPHLAKRFIASNDHELDFVPVIYTCSIEARSSIVGFVFSATERDFDRCTFSLDSISFLHEDWDCNIPLKVDIASHGHTLFSMDADSEDLIGGVCRSMPLTDLEVACISFGGADPSSDFWTHTFGHLEKLDHLKLSDVCAEGLVTVLDPSPRSPKNDDDDLESQSDQIFEPGLQDLEFYDVDFLHPCYGDSCSGCTQCLYHALACRDAEGYGLDRLVIEDCMYVGEGNVNNFREVLGIDVDWDGVSRTQSESNTEQDEEQDEQDEEQDEDDYTF